MVLTSIHALADEDSKEAAVFGAFFGSDLGWIQATFTKTSEHRQKLEFELEGFEPDDFFLLSLVNEDVEMEIAILVPDRSLPPRSSSSIDESNWPMDFPSNFNETTIFRVRDASDAILFEETLKPE